MYRYVERNPLRAGSVQRAEDWIGSSVWARLHPDDPRALPLCDGPTPRPIDGLDCVNQPLTGAEIDALRRCTDRGSSFGSEPWVEQTAKQLDLQTTLRSRGRPPKRQTVERCDSVIRIGTSAHAILPALPVRPAQLYLSLFRLCFFCMVETLRRNYSHWRRHRADGILESMSDVTRILSKIEAGDPQASNELLPLVYDELRKLAAARMASERPDHTLQATALVHEAYVRLVDVETVKKWDSRGHFFAAAGEAMRRILVDAARRQKSLRQGGDRERHDLLELDLPQAGPSLEILSLNEAMDRLEVDHPQAATIVKLRYFCGMTIAEVAEATGVSTATVERNWSYARARLHSELAVD